MWSGVSLVLLVMVRRCYRHRRWIAGEKRTGWRRIDVVEETGSTNADLLARAAAGEDIDGAVLIAESQTAGRGRHGRSWSTPPRSQIALSVGVGVGAVPSEAWGWLPLAHRRRGGGRGR